MTQAVEIMYSARNANAACDAAAKIAIDVDQDWEHEATFYRFEDDSVLVVSGPQVNAYPGMEAARAAIEE